MYHIAQRLDGESFDELNVARKTLREKFSSEILMNRWLFIKFIKLFYCQKTFTLYGMYCKSTYNFWGYEISRIVQKTYGTFSGCVSEWLDNMFLRFCKCLKNCILKKIILRYQSWQCVLWQCLSLGCVSVDCIIKQNSGWITFVILSNNNYIIAIQ